MGKGNCCLSIDKDGGKETVVYLLTKYCLSIDKDVGEGNCCLLTKMEGRKLLSIC